MDESTQNHPRNVAEFIRLNTSRIIFRICKKLYQFTQWHLSYSIFRHDAHEKLRDIAPIRALKGWLIAISLF